MTPAPERVCILRLSALGDTCHAVPLVRTLQLAWPGTRFTWIIGRTEAKLVSLLPGVEFIIVERRDGMLRSWNRLRSDIAAARSAPFDLLLHLQLALRASLLSTAIPARTRLGYDRERAHELQWLFTNRGTGRQQRPHVLDAFFGFAESLGVRTRAADWSLPLPDDAISYAERLVPRGQRTLLLSPCSSHALRNWHAAGYAAVARHAMRDLGWQVVLCGGPSRIEREMGGHILAAYGDGEKPRNQIGLDTLPQLQAALARATALLSPDSGPMHMATLCATPVIGLHAATCSRRSGPYRSLEWCVDRYDEAALRFLGRPSTQVAWGRKIERPGVMDLIRVDDVIERLEALARMHTPMPMPSPSPSPSPGKAS